MLRLYRSAALGSAGLVRPGWSLVDGPGASEQLGQVFSLRVRRVESRRTFFLARYTYISRVILSLFRVL
jgi:hypothetical protein